MYTPTQVGGVGLQSKTATDFSWKHMERWVDQEMKELWVHFCESQQELINRGVSVWLTSFVD